MMRRVMGVAIVVAACGCEGALDGGAPGVDAGGTTMPGVDAGAPRSDAGPVVPEGRVPLFVAVGKMGRIVVSCDGGRTWPIDRSDDEGASCAGIDCDHHPGSSTGITSGGGDIYASFGFGEYPVRLFRSRDGVDWEVVFASGEVRLTGLAWAGDRLLGGNYTPMRSLDRGASFQASAEPDYQVPAGQWPVPRRVAYAPHEGGRIALISGAGDGSWADTTISRDGGETFDHPSAIDPECRGHSRELAYGGGVWVQVWADRGVVCRSTDGGDTWSTATPPGIDSPFELTSAIWTGTEFVIFAGSEGFRSADGASWTPFDVDARVSAVAFDPTTGTYVGASGSYAEQRMYRSADGARWEALDEPSFRRGHPIAYIHFTSGDPSSTCPAP